MEKYQHMSLIGKGNFGSISKIRRISDGKILVWKELNYGKMDEKEKHHIVSEVNILRELHHPNIVKYHDRIIDKKQAKIYIVMEYCQGGDLSQLIKRCKRNNEYINEDVIWKIFTQIALALHACHNHKNGKVLHRDIKPSNVFLDNDNNVKLGDFGLSRVLSNESNFAYSNVGTPYYMSPEQIDENRYNEKSDIWSLGCCLYELASLRPPFEATNHLSLALKIKAGKIERIPLKYSDELNKVIMWMMNVNQNNRPSVDDIVNLTQVNIRIKERRIKESYAKVRLLEETVRLREVKVIEKEKELERRERCVEERERAVKEKEEMLMKLEGRVRNNNTTNNNNNGYFVSESTTLANTNGDSGNNYNYSLKNNSINMKSHLFGYNNETIRTNNSITTNGVNINCTSVDIDNNNNNNIDSHNFKRNDNIQYPNYDIYTSYNNNNNNNNQSDNDADSSDMYNSNNNHIYDKYPHHNKRNSFANNKNNLSSPSLPIATPFKEIHSKQPSSHYNSNSNTLIHNNYQTNTSSSSNNIPITNYSVSHSTNYTHTNNNTPLHNYYTNINSSNSSTYNNTRYSHTNTSSTHANKTERHYSHTQHNNTEYKPYFTNNTHSTTNIPNIHIHNTNNNNNSHEHISLPKSTKNASFTKMTIDYGNNTNYANTNINNIISHNSNIINNTTTKTTHIPLPSNSQRNCIETPKRKITQYFHNNNNNNNNNNNSSNSNQYNHIYTIPRNHSYNNTSQGNFSVNTSYKKKTTFRNNENVPSNNSRRINFETYE